MGHWKIQIPKPSAKRLEKERTFVIVETGAFHFRNHKFPIREGDSELEFDFVFHDNIFHEDNHISEMYLDAGLRYHWYVEYKNSTGSRVEQINVELEEITD